MVSLPHAGFFSVCRRPFIEPVGLRNWIPFGSCLGLSVPPTFLKWLLRA